MTRGLRRISLALVGWLAVASAATGAVRLDRLPLPTGQTVRVYLVRHGQAGLNLPPSAQVRSEDKDRLTAEGEREAERVATALGARRIDAVLASPANRTRQTAKVIADRIGARVEVDERLRPLHMGRGGGHDDAWDVRKEAWRRGRDEMLPDGESLVDAARRAQEVLDTLRGGARGREVVIVSHNEVISPLLASIRARPIARETWRGVANGSITVIDLPPAGPPVVRLAASRP